MTDDIRKAVISKGFTSDSYIMTYEIWQETVKPMSKLKMFENKNKRKENFLRLENAFIDKYSGMVPAAITKPVYVEFVHQGDKMSYNLWFNNSVSMIEVPKARVWWNKQKIRGVGAGNRSYHRTNRI